MTEGLWGLLGDEGHERQHREGWGKGDIATMERIQQPLSSVTSHSCFFVKDTTHWPLKLQTSKLSLKHKYFYSVESVVELVRSSSDTI